MSMSALRRYQVVIWGATGFTGSIASHYIAQCYVKYLNTPDAFNYALAGRSESKLLAVKESVLKETPEAKFDILVGNASDQKSLDDIVSQTDVLISTVGPFTLYGEPVVESCVRNQTHYCDITGEQPWIKRMSDKYFKLAQANKTSIVPSCGFDCVPPDMGVFWALQEAKKKNSSAELGPTKALFTASGAGASGGTMASGMLISSAPDFADYQSRPYYLNMPDDKYKAPKSKPKYGDGDFSKVEFDSVFKRWKTISLFGIPNKRYVHRSDSILSSSNSGYGPQFTFQEAMGAPNVFVAYIIYLLLNIGQFFLKFSWARKLAENFTLNAGEGPSKEQRAKSKFSYKVHAKVAKSNETIVGVMRGGDPGYEDTSKFVVEAAFTLLSKKKKNAFLLDGGILTPATALGVEYLERLDNIGLGFKRE